MDDEQCKKINEYRHRNLDGDIMQAIELAIDQGRSRLSIKAPFAACIRLSHLGFTCSLYPAYNITIPASYETVPESMHNLVLSRIFEGIDIGPLLDLQSLTIHISWVERGEDERILANTDRHAWHVNNCEQERKSIINCIHRYRHQELSRELSDKLFAAMSKNKRCTTLEMDIPSCIRLAHLGFDVEGDGVKLRGLGPKSSDEMFHIKLTTMEHLQCFVLRQVCFPFTVKVRVYWR